MQCIYRFVQPEDYCNANRLTQSNHPNHIQKKIAEQTNVSPKTVQRAGKFAEAVEKVAENVGKTILLHDQAILHLHNQTIRQDNLFEMYFKKQIKWI